MDYKGLFKSTTKEEFTKHLIKMNEIITWLCKNGPSNYKPRPDSIIQSTIIYDMVIYSHQTFNYVANSAQKLLKDKLVSFQEGLSLYHVTNKPCTGITQAFYLSL